MRVMPAAPHGMLAIAAVQTCARGRRGAIWESPQGSVALSLMVHVPRTQAHRLTLLQYVTAVATAEAVKDKFDVQIRVKWPNDLYWQGEKIGGVLCEGTFRDDTFKVVVGVGMNIENAVPTTCLKSILLKEGRKIPLHMRENFIAAFATSMENIYTLFEENGFEGGGIKTKYLKIWLHSGQRVRLGEGGHWGIVDGLSENGCVRVRKEGNNQEIVDLPPDVTSLDLEASVFREKVAGPRKAPG